MYSHRALAAIACGCVCLTPAAWAEPGDEVCFPLYRATGAIPGTPPCPTTAAGASVNLGNTYCTANFGANSSIPRYCGTLPKDLGRCPSTPYPISIGTANKALVETDFTDAMGLLSFTRHYNSTPAAAIGSALGRSWRSSFDASVATSSNGAAVSRPDGRILYFTSGPSGFTADADVNDRLVRQPQTGTLVGWQFRDMGRGLIESYDSSGRLTRTTRTDGRSLTFTYSDASTPVSVAPGPGYLIGVTDDFGRSLDFVYDSTYKRVTRLMTPEGATVAFGYDASGNLSTATYPDGRSKSYVFNEPSFNGGKSQPYALTGLVDENAARTTNYWYDAKGHAVREQHLLGATPVEEYNIGYDTLVGFDASTGTTHSTGQSTLTNPLGSQYVYTFAAVQGVPRMTGVSQPGGAGCLASSSTIGYDANGNIAIRDDFNGTRECKAYDTSRNLESVKVEGLPSGTSCAVTATGSALPTGSRKTSTQWHPDWRLAVRVAEPKKLTVSVYNGQPDPTAGGAVASCAPPDALLPDGRAIVVLCARTEQATTDADGSQGFAAVPQPDSPVRTWRYAYDRFGRLLTQTDPRGNSTANTYYSDTTADHTSADLQSVANAAGHTTRYTRYDRAGRILQSIDPNGATTDYSYSPRGWLTRQTVTTTDGASQTTLYGYDAAGQLTSIRMPDGTSLGYTYDSAHRRVSFTDSAGNTTNYTLDGMGNSTSEEVRDSAGHSARNVSRLFDPLGRVQQATGEAQ